METRWKRKTNITSSSPVQSSVIPESISNWLIVRFIHCDLTRTLCRDGVWDVLFLPAGGAGEFDTALCGVEERYLNCRAAVAILSIEDSHVWRFNLPGEVNVLIGRRTLQHHPTASVCKSGDGRLYGRLLEAFCGGLSGNCWLEARI